MNVKPYLVGMSVLVVIFISSCNNDPTNYEPTMDDKWPHRFDINASWSSDYNQLIYYNGSHSNEQGEITDSTYGIFVKNFTTNETYSWSYNLMIGGGGLSLSPDNEILLFERVYGIYKIPFEIPFNEELIEIIGNDTGPNMYPKWSRDGAIIAVDIRLGDPPGINIMKSDGSNKHHVGPWGGKYPFFSYNNEHIYSEGWSWENTCWEIFKIDYMNNIYTQLSSFNDEFNHFHYVLPNEDEDILIFSAERIEDWGTYIYRYEIETGEIIQLIDKYAGKLEVPND